MQFQTFVDNDELFDNEAKDNVRDTLFLFNVKPLKNSNYVRGELQCVTKWWEPSALSRRTHSGVPLQDIPGFVSLTDSEEITPILLGVEKQGHFMV